MIHRVTLTTDIGQGLTVAHSFEHITETEEEAKESGTKDALLTQAWMEGFSEADLT